MKIPSCCNWKWSASIKFQVIYLHYCLTTLRRAFLLPFFIPFFSELFFSPWESVWFILAQKQSPTVLRQSRIESFPFALYYPTFRLRQQSWHREHLCTYFDFLIKVHGVRLSGSSVFFISSKVFCCFEIPNKSLNETWIREWTQQQSRAAVVAAAMVFLHH